MPNRVIHSAPRVLLRRLREVMAAPLKAQRRLDKIVALIATNMVAEVCSLYVLRADGVLELFASQGLKPQAVHRTNLAIGEGLVGYIAQEAQTLNLHLAHEHPKFVYRPETGEEDYRAFLGVPILRAGRTLGVLVVQNRTERVYSEEEVDALQTAAMLVAEFVVAAELEELGSSGVSIDLSRPLHRRGEGISAGIGLGYVVLHDPRIFVTNLVADDVEAELARLNGGLSRLRVSADDMLMRGELAEGGEHRDVLEAYRMFAYDRGWAKRMRDAVETGLTAEAAVERVQNDTRARMLRQTDPYLRERLHDLDDLANRLLRLLLGRETTTEQNLPENSVLLAATMGPAELLDYAGRNIQALVLEEGGPTSHVAIVARALGIAAVSGVADVTTLAENGDAIIVDGESGDIHVRPPDDAIESYREKLRLQTRQQEQYRALRDMPALTADGQPIQLLLNAGLLIDLPHLETTGAQGIGLFRTELQFMVAARFPRMGAQRALYTKVLDRTGDRPVIFRTLDVGGDKLLPYMRTTHEENPALGWRSIRLGLDRPGLLRSQIRALLHASNGRTLRLLFPMITDIGEFEAARACVETEKAFLTRHGHPLPRKIELGAMIEVPALLWQLDDIVERADFLSVGSNDLLQFLFASDRTNPRLANRYDPLGATSLRVLKQIADTCNAAGCPVTMCGELASNALAAMALIAIGYRNLSMSAPAIGPVKAMLRELDAGDAACAVNALLDGRDSDLAMRDALRDYATDHGVPV